MAYSSNADLERVFPRASGTAIANAPDATYTDTYAYYRSFASAEIDNTLHGLTAVPVDTSTSTHLASGLAEIEALFTAGRMLRANARLFNADSTVLQQANLYDEEASALLSGVYFPASASTPAQVTQFQGTGAGMTVSVTDDFTFKGTWSVRCTEGGDAAKFEIAVLDRHRTYGPWIMDLAEGADWPTQDDIEGSSRFSAVKNITLNITGGAFEIGDTWTFVTYPRTRLSRKQTVGFIPWRRRF